MIFVPEKMNAMAHFESIAPNYDQKINTWFWKYAKKQETLKLLPFFKGLEKKSALEIGCGSGYYLNLLRENFEMEVFGVDQSPAMIQALNLKGIAGQVCALEQLNLKRKFDLILALGLLEFISDLTVFFERCTAHASKGSKLVLLVPRKGWSGTLYKTFHTCIVYVRNKEDYCNAAQNHGWKLNTVSKAWPLAQIFSFEKK